MNYGEEKKGLSRESSEGIIDCDDLWNVASEIANFCSMGFLKMHQ